VEAQEAERRRIACELHDEIGQSLTAVKINLQGIQQRPDGAELGTRLAGSIEIVEHALQQVRNLSLDLRPSLLDDLGLVATLRWYLDRQAQWGGFSAQFVAPPAELSLCSELETTCFRIVQEALTNVLRHAQAHQVRVELQQHEAHLELTIQDDGVGFDVQEALNRAAQGSSLGLLSLLERVTLAGGQLDVESQLGQGTRIRVCCPLCSSDSPFAMTDKMTAGKQ
jgi:signal transduction histidine kinase